MSNTYARLVSEPKSGFPRESLFLDVTAFVGKNGNYSIQLTTSTEYFTLTEKQVKDLINILQARLDCEVTATGYESLGEFHP